jgi:hypothetical protein
MESLQEKIARLKEKYQSERPVFSTKQLFLSRNNPTAIIRIIPVGEDLFPLVGVHTVNKADGKFATYLCPDLTNQKSGNFVDSNDCLICKAIAEINDSKETAKSVAKPRVALKVIHYESQESEENKNEIIAVAIDIKYILLTTDVADQLLDYIAENPDIIDWQKGMLLTITKDYSLKYPTYIFNKFKTPLGVDGVVDLTTDRAKEFIAANDIKLEDAVYTATIEDVKAINFGDIGIIDFGSSIDNKKETSVNTQIPFSNPTPPAAEVANGKGKSSLDAFKKKLMNN